MKTRWIVLIVVLFSLFGGLRAARSKRVAGDFLRYHRAGRLVATGQADKLYDKEFLALQSVYAEERAADLAERGKKADRMKEMEFKYLPTTAIYMSPFGALHPRWGNALWGAWSSFLMAIGFWGCWHVCARGIPKKWLLVPLAILAHVANDNLNLGQINPSAIFPGILGLLAMSRAVQDEGETTFWKKHRFNAAAGLLVAFGTVIKFYPGAIAIWMLWRRRWVAFGFWMLGILAFGGLLPAAVFGPQETVDLTKEYVNVRAHVYTDVKLHDVPGFSVKSFVYRAFGDVPYVKLGSTPIILRVNIASLPPETLSTLAYVINFIILGLFFWVVGWGGARGPPSLVDPLQGGLLLATAVLVSPEARGPHFLYLMLAVVALTGVLARYRERSSERWYRVIVIGLILTGFLLNTSSTGLFGRWLSYRFAAVCAMGWGAAVLWFVVAFTLRRGPFGSPALAEPDPPPLPCRTNAD